jgi:hypothetical protein
MRAIMSGSQRSRGSINESLGYSRRKCLRSNKTNVTTYKALIVANNSGTLNRIMNTTPSNTGSRAGGHFADFRYNGNVFRVVYGTNGYIVSFFPI